MDRYCKPPPGIQLTINYNLAFKPENTSQKIKSKKKNSKESHKKLA